MTKTILVPTDFSPNSLSAIEYACQIAKAKAYRIHLFHCYTSSTSAFEEEANPQTIGNEASLLKADILMADLKTKLQQRFPDLHITAACTRGLIEEKLPREAQNPNYILIVMGATGSSAKKSIYWGSTTVAITAKSPIPVIATPEICEAFDLKHVSLLTKFKVEELETLRAFAYIMGEPERLSLIHVYRETADPVDMTEQLRSWAFNIREMRIIKQVDVSSAPISGSDVNLDTVPEVLNNLIQKNDPDMVLVTKTRKSFFARLFSNSVSKAITLKLKKPAFFDRVDAI